MENVAIRLFDDGRVEWNASSYPAIVHINGKRIGFNPVEGVSDPTKPLKARNVIPAIPNKQPADGQATTQKLYDAVVTIATGRDAENHSVLTWGWALLAATAAVLATALGWLLFRSKGRRGS